MQRGETVAHTDGISVTESGVGSASSYSAHIQILRGIEARTRRAIIKAPCRVFRDHDVGAIGRVVRRVTDRDDRVQGVIGAAQKDEQELFDFAVRAGHADASFGERAFHDPGNIHQGGERHAQTELETAVEEGPSGEDVEVLHRLYCS